MKIWFVCIHLCLCVYKHTSHLYMNSYIHELLIYSCLQRFISAWFWNILVANNRWLQVALIVLVLSCIKLHSGFVSSCYNVLDGFLDGDVFFRSRSWHALHPFTNYMNNIVMNVTYWVAQLIVNSSNTLGYPSCSLLSHVNTFHGKVAVY